MARHPEYSNDSYVRDNLAVLHIYFRWQGILHTSYRNLHFMRNERDELYGFVAIVSNIGERRKAVDLFQGASWASAWASPCSQGLSSSTSLSRPSRASATGSQNTEHTWREHV